VIFPAEQLADDVHVAEKIGNTAMVRLPLDVVKKDRATTVQLFLNSGDLQVRIDLFVGLDQVAIFFHPLYSAAQISDGFDRSAVSFLSLSHCFLQDNLSF
jgi:hypothetical protein